MPTSHRFILGAPPKTSSQGQEIACSSAHEIRGRPFLKHNYHKDSLSWVGVSVFSDSWPFLLQLSLNAPLNANVTDCLDSVAQERTD